jgi:RimJ/RimL family protein N-acetyltransferase
MLDQLDLSTPAERRLVFTRAYPSDLDALIALFARSSDESRRQRFHGTTRQVPCDYLHDVVSGASSVIAAVARDLEQDEGQRLVGVATASLETTDRAELAVWIDDHWQRRGLGLRLACTVLGELRRLGATTAVAYLEPNNAGARALSRRIAEELGTSTPSSTLAVYPLDRAQPRTRT